MQNPQGSAFLWRAVTLKFVCEYEMNFSGDFLAEIGQKPYFDT